MPTSARRTAANIDAPIRVTPKARCGCEHDWKVSSHAFGSTSKAKTSPAMMPAPTSTPPNINSPVTGLSSLAGGAGVAGGVASRSWGSPRSTWHGPRRWCGARRDDHGRDWNGSLGLPRGASALPSARDTQTPGEPLSQSTAANASPS